MASFYNNYYRYYRPYSSTNFRNSPDSNYQCSTEDKVPCDDDKKEEASKCYSFGPINFKNPFFTDIEEPIFEILGIQLYLDDIIIIGLLFFLYQESVQDEMLFIALILLLIT